MSHPTSGRAAAEERTLVQRLEGLSGRKAWHFRKELLAIWKKLPGRKEERLALSRKAAEEDPFHAEAWELLAEVCLDQGRREEAVRALERAASTSPRAAERAGAWARLAELRRRSSEPTLADARAEAPGEAWERLAAAQAEIRASPLVARGYRALQGLFEASGDAPRAHLMEEVADALDGRAAYRSTSRLPLLPEERSGLRHPALRGPAGELLNRAAPLLLADAPLGAGPPHGSAFEGDEGPGAKAVSQALKLAAQVLAMPEPEAVVVPGRSLHLEHRADGVGGLEVAIPRGALDAEPSKGGLRFEAAACVFSQNGDVGILRALAPAQLEERLTRVRRAVLRGKALSGRAGELFEAMSADARARLEELLRNVPGSLDWPALRAAAEISACRAGLVVAGSLGPGLEALRAAKAPDSILSEVVRFAASERYFLLRLRSRT